jgi:hypothetical protein
MLSVEFGYSPWLALVCLAIAGGLSYWMYQRLNVEISTWLRRGLMALRFLSLFLILLLLLEPLFTTIFEQKNNPIIVVLQDGSESVVAHKDSNAVKSTVPKFLAQLRDALEKEDWGWQPFIFGNDLEPLPKFDTIRYNRSGTDLAQALSDVSEQYANQNLGAIVCVSDGIVTAGLNPRNIADKLNVPIFSVLVGDTTTSKDLLIESVLYNELTYKNTETPIQVTVRNRAMGNRVVQVKLTQRGALVASQTVTLSDNLPVANANFNVKLTQAGIVQYEVSIDELPGEVSYQNNRQLIFIKVLETRLRVAFFANGPHPDVGALQRCLQKDDRYAVVPFIRKSETEFYNNPNLDLSNIDVFILQNFPAIANDKPILDKIYQEVDNRRVPLLHFVGSSTRLNIHPKQRDYMALFANAYRGAASEAFLSIQPAYINHSSYRFTDQDLFKKWLESAPPLLRNDSEWQAKPDALIFAKTKIKGIALDYPFFAAQDNARQKNVVFLGENFWRYRLHCYTETQSFDLFDEWIYNLIQWSATKSDNRLFKVYSSQSKYTSTEPVLIKGQVYDDSNKPISGAEVKLSLANADNQKTDYYLSEPQTGNYQLTIQNLKEGTYSFVATGTYRGKALGTDVGQFSVGRSAIEFVQLRADYETMQQMALRTKGNFYTLKDNPDVAKAILNHPAIKPIVDLKKETQSLNRLLWPIILILILLATEWVIRKRYSLI